MATLAPWTVLLIIIVCFLQQPVKTSDEEDDVKEGWSPEARKLFDDSIVCLNNSAKSNGFIECTISKMPMDNFALELDIASDASKTPSVVGKCRFGPMTPFEAPGKIVFFVKEFGFGRILATRADGIIDTMVVKITEQEPIIKINDKKNGHIEIEAPRIKDRHISWEFTRNVYNFEENLNCYYAHLFNKVDLSTFMSFYTPMPVELHQRGQLLTVPKYALPFGNIFITVIISTDKTSINVTTPYDVTADNEYLLSYDVNPFPVRYVWPNNSDFLVNLTNTFSPHLTPKSGFFGDPDEVLSMELKCITIDSDSEITQEGKSFLIKKEVFSKTYYRKMKFQLNFKFKPENDGIATLSANRDFGLRRDFTIEVADSKWPPTELRCIRNCIQSWWYLALRRVFLFYCPACKGNRYNVDIFEPCIGDEECGNKHPSVTRLISDENQLVYVMNYKLHDLRKYYLGSIHRKLAAASNSKPKVDIKCVNTIGIIDCQLKENKYPLSEKYFTTFYYTASWSFGKKTISLPWLTTTQKSVSDIVFGLCYENKLILLLPKIQCFVFKELSRVGAIENIALNNMKCGKPSNDPLLLYRFFKNMKKKVFGYELHYGLRLTWLLVKAASNPSYGRKAPIKGLIYNQCLTGILKSQVRFTDIDILLNILQMALSETDIRLGVDALNAIQEIMDKIIEQLTSVVRDMPMPVDNKQCLVVDTLVQLYKRYTSKHFILSSSFYKNLGSKVLKVANHIVKTTSKRKQICSGHNWQLQVIKRYVELRSSHTESLTYDEFIYNEKIKFKFNRDILYKRLENFPSMVTDYTVYTIVFHMTDSLLNKAWSSNNEFTSGTTMVEHMRAYDTETLNQYREESSLQIEYELKQRAQQRGATLKHGKMTSANILKFGYIVKEGKLFSDCTWIMVRTNQSVFRSLTIEFESVKGAAMKYLVRIAMISSSRELVNFDKLADLNYYQGGRIVYNIKPVTKKYIYQYPNSDHVFLVKLESVEGQPDGVYQSQLDMKLIGIYCSFLSNPETTWNIGVCIPSNVQLESITCDCDRASGMYSTDVVDATSHLSKMTIHSDLMSVLHPDRRPTYFNVLFFMLLLWMLFFGMCKLVLRKDKANDDMYRTHLVPFHFNPEDRYRYMICLKTSALPNSGMMSKAWIVLIGTLRTTGEMLLNNDNHFITRSEVWFLISSALSLGDIKAVTVRIECGHRHDHWRINHLDVYDITKDYLIRVYSVSPFSRRKSWQICASNDEEKSVTYNQRLTQNFTEYMKVHHVILAGLLVVPGAQPTVRSVIRFQCLVLWSFVITILFVVGVPKYAFADDKLLLSGDYVFLYTPLLAVVDKIIHVFLSKVFLNDHWRTRLHGRRRPQKRTVCPKTKYECTPVSVNNRTHPPFPEKFNGIEQKIELEAKKLIAKAQVTPKRGRDKAPIRVEPEEVEITNVKMRTDLRRYKGQDFSIKMKQLISELEKPNKEDTRRSNVLKHQSKGLRFVYIPIPSMIAQDSCKKDPGIAETTVIGKQIYSPTTPDTLKPKHGNFTVPLDDIDVGQILIKNTVMLCISIIMALTTAFIVQTSLHQSYENNVYTIMYAFTMVFVDLSFLEPLNLFIFALFSSISNKGDATLHWARRRSIETNEVIKRLYRLQEVNFVNRFRYIASWEYKSLGNNQFQHLIVNLQRMKDMEVDMGTIRGGRMRLMILILCAITIINVHSDVYGSYLMKKGAFNDLNLRTKMEYTAAHADDLWIYLKNNHIPFFNKGGKVLQKFSRIRQVRAQPADNCFDSRFEALQFDDKHCHTRITEDTQEQRNFCNSWNKTLGDVDPMFVTCNDMFVFKPVKPDSIFEFAGADYPLGGYQYIMRRNSKLDDEEAIDTMQKMKWVDENTRAVLIETTLFDLNSGIAGVLISTYRFQMDGIRVTHNCDTFAFVFTREYFMILYAALGIWAILTLAEISTQLSKITTIGIKNFINDIENIVHLINLCFYIILLAGFAVRMQLTKIKYAIFQKAMFGTDGALYISLRDISVIVMTLNSISGFLALGALLILFENARHLHRFKILVLMIRHVFLLAIAPVICIVWLGFLIYVRFNTEAYQVSTLLNSIYTVVEFIVRNNQLKIGDSSEKRQLTVGLWFVFFILITNGFVVSLNEDYSVLVMEERTKQARAHRALIASYGGYRGTSLDKEKNLAQYKEDQRLLLFSSSGL